MTIDTLTAENRSKTFSGLAGIDVQRLKMMRNAGLRSCFNH